jgi:ABC-type dipeptide/oligopeptide/nickel transport system permease component
VAASTRSKLLKNGAMISAIIGLSVPNFWLAILLIIVFGVNLKWVSVTGGSGLKDLILPALTLGVVPAAVLARLTRSSIEEVIREDYVRTARTKGLSWRRVTAVHVLRNALIPVVTVIGLQLAGLLAGAVFIENVFARPGLGRFAVNAIAARDYPQVQGTVVFAAAVYVVVNLIVDLLYAVLDPRIRYS